MILGCDIAGIIAYKPRQCKQAITLNFVAYKKSR
jgi:hypothetical protein